MFDRARVFPWTAAIVLAVSSAVAQTPPLATTLDLEDGQVTLAWVSSSSFRYCRSWGDEKCRGRVVGFNDRIKVDKKDTPSHLALSTEYVTVEINKKDGRLRVADSKDKELMLESAPVRRYGTGVTVERTAIEGEAFFGLGARTDAQTDARGHTIRSSKPFLISTRGYGLYHESPGEYVFDLGASVTDRYRITMPSGEQFDYYFYYGPDPKSIMEEHKLVVLPRGVPRFEVLEPATLPKYANAFPSPTEGSWSSLAGSVHAIVHASLSAMMNPVFDLAPYRNAPDLLFRRAAQLASVMPLVSEGAASPLPEEKRKVLDDMLRWRRRLVGFLRTYADETGDRGYPMIHPLAMQYPNDARGAKLADQFLLGDEILVAPIYTESDRRTVYFPMGNWTDLRTNRVYPGRQEAEIEAPAGELPLFLRNGSIIPLVNDEDGGPMILHYTPKLAAEFFLYEDDINEYSQYHASPALDLMRLEIESHKARSYEWIVHHIPAAREVRSGENVLSEVKDRSLLVPGRWYYDRERENIHIALDVPAGATRVVHIEF